MLSREEALRAVERFERVNGVIVDEKMLSSYSRIQVTHSRREVMFNYLLHFAALASAPAPPDAVLRSVVNAFQVIPLESILDQLSESMQEISTAYPGKEIVLVSMTQLDDFKSEDLLLLFAVKMDSFRGHVLCSWLSGNSSPIAFDDEDVVYVFIDDACYSGMQWRSRIESILNKRARGVRITCALLLPFTTDVCLSRLMFDITDESARMATFDVFCGATPIRTLRDEMLIPEYVDFFLQAYVHLTASGIAVDQLPKSIRDDIQFASMFTEASFDDVSLEKVSIRSLQTPDYKIVDHVSSFPAFWWLLTGRCSDEAFYHSFTKHTNPSLVECVRSKSCDLLSHLAHSRDDTKKVEGDEDLKQSASGGAFDAPHLPILNWELNELESILKFVKHVKRQAFYPIAVNRTSNMRFVDSTLLSVVRRLRMYVVFDFTMHVMQSASALNDTLTRCVSVLRKHNMTSGLYRCAFMFTLKHPDIEYSGAPNILKGRFVAYKKGKTVLLIAEIMESRYARVLLQV